MPLANDKLKKFNNSLENQENASGVAQKAFNKLTDTVSGQTNALANNIGNLTRVFDEVFGPGLKDLLTEVNAQIFAFTRFIRGIEPGAIKAAVSMAGFAAKIFLANKAFILLQKTAAITFAQRIIPLLLSTKAKLVATKIATAGLATSMRLLKLALPFGVILVGLEAVIGALVRANVAQRDLNNVLEFGTEKQLENRIEVEKDTRALIENTIETLRNKIAKAGKEPTALEIEMGIDTGGKSGAFVTQLKAAETRLNNVGKTLLELSKKLFKLSGDRRQAEAASKAEIEELLQSIKDAAKEVVDPASDQQKQLNSLEEIIRAKTRENALASDITDAQRIGLGFAFQQADLQRQFPTLTEEQLAPMRKVLQEGVKIKLNALGRKEEEKSVTEVLTEQEKMYQRIGQTISTGIVDGLTQAKSATEALNNVLRDTARQLLQLGVNSLLKVAFPASSLFSALPGFANGGRPAVGRPSVVGERGPELFVPDRAGTILPNGVGMGGGTTITVNVDASETSADASSGQGAQLGKAIGLAVQQELIKQKRPGGLIAAF